MPGKILDHVQSRRKALALIAPNWSQTLKRNSTYLRDGTTSRYTVSRSRSAFKRRDEQISHQSYVVDLDIAAFGHGLDSPQ